MSKSLYHPDYCRCPRCAPRHPTAREIAPALRASLYAFAMLVGLIALFWVSSELRDHLSYWS